MAKLAVTHAKIAPLWDLLEMYSTSAYQTYRRNPVRGWAATYAQTKPEDFNNFCSYVNNWATFERRGYPKLKCSCRNELHGKCYFEEIIPLVEAHLLLIGD